MMSDDDIQAELNSMSEEEREANDAAYDTQMADMLSMYQAERKAYKIELADKFNDYIYENYTVNNGEQLINILENGQALESFLDYMGLPEDTEIDL